MSVTTGAPADSTVAADLGRPKLTTIHAIGQSLAVGPIFSAGAILATVAATSGFNTPLAVLFAFVGSLALAYVISLYARRYAGAGAMYEYLAKGVTNSFGIFSAAVYVLGLMFLGAGGVYIALGFLTEGFFDAHIHTSIPWWLGGAIGLVLVLYLNYAGVRASVRGVLALAVVSAIPFVLLAVVIIAKGGADGNTLAVFDPGQTSWDSVFKGILFAVTLFIGFEAAASVAEETANPRRAIPVAVLATVGICGAFYLLMSYSGTIGFGEAKLGAENAWAASPSGFGELADQYVGSWLSWIVDLVIIFDALSLSIAFMVAASRVIFALGRDGLLPRFAATTTRRETPLGGTIILGVWSVIMLLWAASTNYGKALGGVSDPFATFLVANATGSYLVELIYIFLSLAALGLVWRSRHSEGGLAWKIPVILAGLATPILAYKGSLDPFPKYPLNRGVYYALALIGVSALWWLYLRIRHPDRVATAAAHALHAEATPPHAPLPTTKPPV
jgi:amino acid transporter